MAETDSLLVQPGKHPLSKPTRMGLSHLPFTNIIVFPVDTGLSLTLSASSIIIVFGLISLIRQQQISNRLPINLHAL